MKSTTTRTTTAESKPESLSDHSYLQVRPQRSNSKIEHCPWSTPLYIDRASLKDDIVNGYLD